MAYIRRGAQGGPYVYSGVDGYMHFYNMPGRKDALIPQSLFDEVAVIHFAGLVEDGELDAVIERLRGERPELRDWLTAIRVLPGNPG